VRQDDRLAGHDRHHIRDALIAARPNGLSMPAIVEAITGPWSPREVQDVVRRLWYVGELARRGDGTFVLTTRAGKEPRAAGAELVSTESVSELPSRYGKASK
jgi:hypothetical protein